MKGFTLSDVEKITGIKRHRWKKWEEQYQLFVCSDEGEQRRSFDNEALKKLLRIAFLHHNGWKMADITMLDNEGILGEIQKIEISITNYRTAILRMMEAAMDFNEAALLKTFNELIAIIGFEKCITDVCYPYLQRINLLSTVMPIQEHFSHHWIKNKIIGETEKLKGNNQAPELLLCSPNAGDNELQLLFLHYVLRKNGWNLIYLGDNVSKEIIKPFAIDQTIKILFLHLSPNFEWDADMYFEDLCKTFSDKMVVVTGGPTHTMQRTFVNLRVLKNDEEVYEFVTKGSLFLKLS